MGEPSRRPASDDLETDYVASAGTASLSVHQCLQLKVTLKGWHPPIWRTVLLPATASLSILHRVVQILYGVGRRPPARVPGPAGDLPSQRCPLFETGPARIWAKHLGSFGKSNHLSRTASRSGTWAREHYGRPGCAEGDGYRHEDDFCGAQAAGRDRDGARVACSSVSTSAPVGKDIRARPWIGRRRSRDEIAGQAVGGVFSS